MNTEQDFHILYVEDDDDAFEAWGERLEKLDTRQFEGNTRHRVQLTRAHNQAEALAAVEAAGNRGPDLVVLDLRYPVDNKSQADNNIFQGLEWLPELSQKLPEATIAVFTAYSIERHMQNAVTALLRDGAHEFIPKGTPWAEIEVRLRFAWKFAHHSREKQVLQRETIELLRSRAAQTHLIDACSTVDRHVTQIKSLAFELERMGVEEQRLADKFRGRLDALNKDIHSIVLAAYGGTGPSKFVADLSCWLRDSLFWYFLEYRTKHVKLEWPTEPVVSIRSYVDDVRVVVHELLQNALCSVVASSRTDGHVVVTTSMGEQGAQVIVLDNGIGFSPEDLKNGQVFHGGYSHWPNIENPIVEHQGMGLNIARRLVNNLGGSLNLENVDADDRVKGARVKLIIPNLPEKPEAPR